MSAEQEGGTPPSEARFPEVRSSQPHYESFYLKAGHPAGGVAVWIRYTVSKPPGREPTATVWLTLFDRAARGPTTARATFPAGALRAGAAGTISIADSEFSGEGARGRLCGEGQAAAWRLRFQAGAPPFRYLPSEWMYAAPLPRTKAVSVHPAVLVSGELELGERTWQLEAWRGMVGHNWGQEHPARAVWLHGSGFSERPDAYFDAVLARVRVGPLLLPWIGNGCLCLDGRRYRLGGLRPGASRISAGETGARFTLRGSGITVEGEAGAPPENFVGWRYAEPGGGWHPTLHCSIADLTLGVTLSGRGGRRELSVVAGASYEVQLPEVSAVELQPFAPA